MSRCHFSCYVHVTLLGSVFCTVCFNIDGRSRLRIDVEMPSLQLQCRPMFEVQIVSTTTTSSKRHNNNCFSHAPLPTSCKLLNISKTIGKVCCSVISIWALNRASQFIFLSPHDHITDISQTDNSYHGTNELPRDVQDSSYHYKVQFVRCSLL